MPLHCIQNLIGEHRAVEKVLGELEGLIDDFLTTQEIPAGSLAALDRIAEFLSRDLVLHIQKEDDGLFPALGRFMPAQLGPLAVMRGEHEQITESFRGLLEGLTHLKCCSTTDSAGAGEVRDHGRILIQVLRSHLFKEEHVLFPFAESRLSPEDDRQILQKLEEFTADFSRAASAHPHA
ncbi:MAG: hemerythrin domain-containing protein [Acidobacteria bacterium]|nr:hemerythrin domain-containing protein [Acidobacteriota bacterium]